MRKSAVALLALAAFVVPPAHAAKTAKPAKASGGDAEKQDAGPFSAGTFAGLSFRGIGPAIVSGRIADFAVDPSNVRRPR